MRTINMHEAKTHLSKLVQAVNQGEEILIALAGKPIARLVPVERVPQRRFGVLKGQLTMAEDFNAPLSDGELAEFES